MLLLLMAYLMLVLGIAMAGSRFGLIQGVLASLAALWILRGYLKRATPRAALLWVALVLVVFFPLVIQFGAADIVARFLSESLDNDARWQITHTTWAAMLAFFPFGTGVGSFQEVYQLFEKTSGLSPLYINQAHNDWLQLILEGGLPAMIVAATWLSWLIIKSLPSAGVATENLTAKALTSAGCVAAWLLAIHSLVDYPLRTTALSAMLAFYCGMLCRPGPVFRPALETERFDGMKQIQPYKTGRSSGMVYAILRTLSKIIGTATSGKSNRHKSHHGVGRRWRFSARQRLKRLG